MIDGISALGSMSASAPASGSQPAGATTSGASFEDALKGLIGSAVDTLQAGESAAIQGVIGAASPMKVVDSVMAAQRSLQTFLAIRDKAVAAYQDIARMAI